MATPTFLTPLVGRGRDLAAVAALLRDARLVTLVGAGGSGKTRLAAGVASELEQEFAPHFAWVELAPISDPELVGVHVAGLLGAREESSRPASERIAAAIAARPALLVLDNCEHLIEACAALAEALLHACPALRILSTSQQPLGVRGEKAWVVPPLALPAPGEEEGAAACSAIQLFVQRAGDALSSFELTERNRDAVVQICRRLDGLPLAIELAAARVKVLPPEQLAARLDDVFAILTSGARSALPRHRTLRALIDWSYGLLSEDERRLLDRLTVFAGGFTLESAEAVAAFGRLDQWGVLDLLAALVEKSLVTMREQEGGEARYALLETVRQYARERLRAGAGAPSSGGAAPDDSVPALARRHALHYAQLAERAASQLHRAAQLEWLARLDAEHDNLRAALRWSLDGGAPEVAMRLCVALRDYWRVRGHLTEGLRWLDEALQASTAGGAPDVLRARAIVAAAVLARRLGKHDVFRARVAEGEAFARALGGDEAAELADALTQRGVYLRDVGEHAEARSCLDEAISLWRVKGDAWGLTHALCSRSAIAHAEGALPLARALRLEAVEVSRRAGDREGEAYALIGLGELARVEGDALGARAYFERSMTLFRELGDSWHVAALLHNQGWVAAESGAFEEARRSFAAALALFRSEQDMIVAPCLVGLSRLLVAAGDPGLAAVAFASAMASLERAGLRPAAADTGSFDRTRAAIESALGGASFARAWAIGATTGPAEYVRRALERLERLERAADTRHQQPPPRLGTPAAGADSPDVAESPPPALRVRALGPLDVQVNGAAVDAESFGSKKARELLLLLLCRPDGCTREQVGVVFWPDASAAEVKNRFHVTLHRLRKALGRPEWIAASEERYRIAPDLCVEFDAARFESEITASMRAAAAGGGSAERLGAALAVYRGDFLEQEGAGDWHLEPRERLRRLWVDGQLAHGDLLVRAERLADAAAAYRALLARDPLHEAACRRLMECCARMGQRVEAIRQFDRLARLLRDELGVEPDAETAALYERLQEGAARS